VLLIPFVLLVLFVLFVLFILFGCLAGGLVGQLAIYFYFMLDYYLNLFEFKSGFCIKFTVIYCTISMTQYSRAVPTILPYFMCP